MEERYEEVLNCYDFKVRSMSRARGAFRLETDQGIKLLKPWEASAQKAWLEYRITSHLVERGYKNVDYPVKNTEGMLITPNSRGEKYIVKNWFQGEECRVREKNDVIRAAENLGRLHKAMVMDKELLYPEPEEDWEEDGEDSLPQSRRLVQNTGMVEIFEKHNRELKRTQTYIKAKKQKNEFERAILKSFEPFYRQASDGLSMLQKCEFDKQWKEAGEKDQLCHGSYTYHNVWMLRGKETATVDFEKAGYGLPVMDLYYFLRKVMEKNDWEIYLGEALIQGYIKERSLTEEERRTLGILLYYPEKYWKIVNHYLNNKKSWIADKDKDKLEMICQQEWRKTLFLRQLFSLSF